MEKRLATANFAEVKGRTIRVYASLWNTEARLGDFTESFAPGAFDRSLADRTGKRDVIALAQHNPDQYLARQANGTMRLVSDARGLAVEIDLPETQLGNDIKALADRGDLGGASVGFIATKESWNGNHRTVEEAELLEVSLVTHAAYEDTGKTLSVRQLYADAEASMRAALYMHYLGGGR
ncbi:HK97 family phage prohead protease [Rhizobium multihospitium]|uniref:Prohead serine protease domain-containing protein n=1 Tax=Rhizobium multihospitium TaxID=410764 RepID=A0A1C3WLC4_9HYPH|nr:HK97 family phage prohead protease [Rhizobium multihospitium]SCB40770.1 hypothetical protein GA0061103_5694 [Rhizobium multihospitium]